MKRLTKNSVLRTAPPFTAIVAMALLATGCSGGDGIGKAFTAADPAPLCADVFAPGRPTADVLADFNAEGFHGCLNADGDLDISPVAWWDCPDGRKVHQSSSYGWGFSDGPWNGSEVPEPYADCVLPGTDAQHP